MEPFSIRDLAIFGAEIEIAADHVVMVTPGTKQKTVGVGIVVDDDRVGGVEPSSHPRTNTELGFKLC